MFLRFQFKSLADMDKMMRTGIVATSLANGPSSAVSDEYVPQPLKKHKKVKKEKRRSHLHAQPPPPPPPKRQFQASDPPPPPPGGPRINK